MMADDRPEDAGPLADGSRPKRAPPTIDLEATEVSGGTGDPASDSAEVKTDSADSALSSSPPRSSPAFVSAICGAAAAALVLGAAWLAGWPGTPTAAEAPASQGNAAAIDDLKTRIAKVESGAGLPAAPAPDSRVDSLEKSIGSLRAELAAARSESEKIAAALNEVKSTAPGVPASPDMSAINERIAQIERATRTLTAENAQHAAPADDALLRRVVVATLLDVSVRQGEPYGAMLATAKSLAADAGVLKPLETFATSGVPNANALCRELTTLVPKLSPTQNTSTTGSGIVDRLQEGASRLVRIQRTDATAGDDRGAIAARVTAAALRNDIVGARRELNALAPADRVPVQPWIDKDDARIAALAASRQFATDAMAALNKPAR